MISMIELMNLREFVKQLIDQEIRQKDHLTKQVFQYYPLEVAKNIINKIEKGEDVSSVVAAFLTWDEKKKLSYGNVKWLD